MAETRSWTVPKDPRTPLSLFLRGMPVDLEGTITEGEWAEVIDGINGLVLEYERPYLVHLLSVLLIFPALFELNRFGQRLAAYIAAVNERMARKGVRFHNPADAALMEIRVDLLQPH